MLTLLFFIIRYILQLRLSVYVCKIGLIPDFSAGVNTVAGKFQLAEKIERLTGFA